MSRKRKHADAWSQNDFLVPAAEVNSSSSRNAVVVTQHVEGNRMVQQTTIVPAPDPAVATMTHRDFEDIRDLLGDTDDVQTLQGSEDVIHHYIQGPGFQQKKKTVPSVPGQFATTVRFT